MIMRFFIFVLALVSIIFVQPIMAADGINITAVQIKTQPSNMKVNVKMPQIHGLVNQQVQQRVNQNIHDTIYKYIDTFKQEATKNTIGSGKQKSNLTITYKTIFVDKNYLSLMLEITAYHPRMAHPDNQLQTLNYYLPEAKLLELKDLFTTQDYLKQISTFAAADLVERIPQMYGYDPKAVPEHFNYQDAKDWVLRGTEGKAENYQHFSLQPQKLIIYFDYYQVGPRPTGIVEVSIPITKLQKIFEQKYVSI